MLKKYLKAFCPLIAFTLTTETIAAFTKKEVINKHEEVTQLSKTIIPFENQNGSIILTVKINDFKRPLRLLFDTGADGMALSQSLADEIGLKITRENNASVVGGNTKIKISDGNKVQLGDLQLDNMGIAIFPNLGRDHCDGIIGNTLLRRYLTYIDYDNSQIVLSKFEEFQPPVQTTAIPIDLSSGVMLLPGQLEIVKGKSYAGHFVFDTGASYDLICFRPFVRQNRLLVSGFKPEFQAATVSMGTTSPTFYGKSYQFTIPSLQAVEKLPVTLMGGSGDNENWNPGADGSIGVRLLSRYNITINTAANQIYLSPNRLHTYPQDFTLKKYQFGWDNQGYLNIISNIGAEQINELASGKRVAGIANYSDKQLQKDPKLITDLLLKVQSETITIQLDNNKTITLE